MNTPWDHIFNEGTGLGTSLTLLMYRKPYRETYDFIQQSQWWTADQIQEYQWQQLKTMLDHAYTHVPYYKKLFDMQGISPQGVQSLSDFHRIPFLTKPLVIEHIDDLRATNYPAYAFEENITGGSTGFPLRFYVEKGAWYARHIAYIQALIERAGCRVMDKSVHMTDIDKPWEYRPLSRELVLSLFHMTDAKLPVYVKKIKEFHPEYILGYPSGMTILAQYMKRNDITINPLKAIIYYGETLYDWQREFLESTFHCRVHGQYGHRENCVLAGTCEKSDCFHVFPDYGFIELVDSDGNQVVKEGQVGEVVATGFRTGIFPFIRYKTGDIAVFTSCQCECGRHFQLLKSIEGRVQDFIVSKSQRYVPFYGVHHLAAASSPNVKEWQIYQDHEGELVFNIVKKEQFSDDDMHQILKNFQRRYGDEFTVTFNFIDSIPRTPRQKYQFLIQKLPIRF